MNFCTKAERRQHDGENTSDDARGSAVPAGPITGEAMAGDGVAEPAQEGDDNAAGKTVLTVAAIQVYCPKQETADQHCADRPFRNLMLMLGGRTSDAEILAQTRVRKASQAPISGARVSARLRSPCHCISHIPGRTARDHVVRRKAARRRAPALQGSVGSRTRRIDLSGSGSRLPGYEIWVQ